MGKLKQSRRKVRKRKIEKTLEMKEENEET